MNGATLSVVAVVLQAAAPALFDIAPGPADQAVNRLAAQAGIDVVVRVDLRGRRTAGLRGRMSAEAALDRLLRPLGARAVRIGDRMYRVEALPRSRPAPPAPSPPGGAGSAPAVQLSEVIVTALPPVGYGPTGADPLDPGALARLQGGLSSSAVADLSATVDSTRQGAGRNKLFVRGLADSAMNGPLQATVGQYLGDLRLSHGSPDPDLVLVDIARIEVFEGPQGTRFGAGSIGGVLRLRPEAPVLDDRSARLTLGAGVTSGGGDSADAAIVVNRTLGDRSAGRLVAYARRDGGFLDQPKRDLSEADAVDTAGARASVHWSGEAWTLDAVVLAQRVEADDSQTVPAAAGRLGAGSDLPEPYRSTVFLTGVSARRRLGVMNLTSAASVSRQVLEERFDATQPSGPPAIVRRRQQATTASAELRIDNARIGAWSLSGGGALALGETTAERRRMPLSAGPGPAEGADLRRRFSEAAIFGEASLSPAPAWRVALGARLSAVRIDAEMRPATLGGAEAVDRDGWTARLSPSLTARWELSDTTTVFARVEQAVRPAGVSDADAAFRRYRGDRVTLFEVGARSDSWRENLSGEISAGWIDWRDVQADIVTPGGDLATDNVGDGTIRFVSLKAVWRPIETLEVSGGMFFNHNTLVPSRLSVIGAGRTDIPNVAPLGAQLGISREGRGPAGLPLRLGADFRYVGRSRLGVGPGLDVPHGGYLAGELTARLGDDRRAATLRVSNPFDGDGVRYGMGSPYRLWDPQVAPVRPLTVRLSFDAAF